MSTPRDPIRAALLRRKPPRWDVSRVFGALTPSPAASLTAGLSVMLLLPVFAVSAFAYQSTAGNEHPFDFALAAMLFSWATPFVGFGLVIAGLLAGRPGARSLLLLVATAVLLLGGTSCGVALEMVPPDPEHPREAGQAFLTGLAVAGSPGVIAGMLALISVVFTPIALRRELHRERVERAVALLTEFGSLGLTEVQAAVGADHDGTIGILGSIDDVLKLRIDPELDRVSTQARAARRNALLLAQIEQHGTRSFTQLAEHVGEPEPVIRHWVGELIDSGILDAGVEGDEVKFKAARPFSPCGGCGGPIAAVGGSIGRCVHCGSEAYG